MKVEIEQQVVDFIRGCAPHPRKVLREALRALAQEKGDIRPLEGPLQDYYRLRVGSYRVIFRYAVEHHRSSIRCVFAERRSIVYEVFERMLTEEAPNRR